MTLLYGFYADNYFMDDSYGYFATKAEALKEAREAAKNWPDGEVIKVEQLVIRDLSRKTLVAMLNGRGWCGRRDVVAEIPGRRKRNEED